jgi:TRAP-type uncharacterized transport system substrate-binding protein
MADADELNTADRAKSAQPGDAEQTRTFSSNAEDNMIALVMARSDIKSVADLAGKDVAIDDPQWVSSGIVRTAIAAAGATDPAAVLTLVSKEAGDWFPEIAGFRVFRVPLSPVR